MTAQAVAILDACVLVPAPLRDTLLRLAESPSLYVPRWSDEILSETSRTLLSKIGLSKKQTSHLEAEMRRHFPNALVSDYAHLVGQMQNDPKDRHVLAAAVESDAQFVVTYN